MKECKHKFVSMGIIEHRIMGYNEYKMCCSKCGKIKTFKELI